MAAGSSPGPAGGGGEGGGGGGEGGGRRREGGVFCPDRRQFERARRRGHPTRCFSVMERCLADFYARSVGFTLHFFFSPLFPKARWTLFPFSFSLCLCLVSLQDRHFVLRCKLDGDQQQSRGGIPRPLPPSRVPIAPHPDLEDLVALHWTPGARFRSLLLGL